MRDVYWKHIAESKKRLTDENPTKSKYEILGMARAESGTEIQHQRISLVMRTVIIIC